jgi:hypothetical protein
MNAEDFIEPAEFSIVRKEQVRPTPDILDALEKDYPFEASLADLIDNSIDAKADKVLIRFHIKKATIKAVFIIDNGKGMNEETLREAMQFAKKRKYSKTDLGMFGVGLKTASLSQANILTVVSKAKSESVVGRQWTKKGIKEQDWQLYTPNEVNLIKLFSTEWGYLKKLQSGTVVVWSEIDDFIRLRVGISSYLHSIINKIKVHLGLKLYRFLQKKKLEIRLDVFDEDAGQAGIETIIEPLCPFPQKGQSASTKYPKTFYLKIPKAGNIKLLSHIWKKKSNEDGYKLGGGKVAEHQGFYFFRNDRLITDGGWCDIIGTCEPHLSLARVEIDIPDSLGKYIKVRSNKDGVDIPHSFASSVFKAKASDGLSFEKYLKEAEDIYRKKGDLKPKAVIRPGFGIPAKVKEVLQDNKIPFLNGRDLQIDWKTINSKTIVDLNPSKREINLNKKYRKLLLGKKKGSKTDFPLLRTLLYFIFEPILNGEKIGPIEKIKVNAIKGALTEALKNEINRVKR